MINPFQITRAADLDDHQINQLWVDPGNKLTGLLHPASSLPMIILGGRGSGKTHLVRYHSYALQRKVHGRNAMLAKVREDKYLGIVFRCTGLHASRFSRKRIPEAQWNDLFGLHLELTLGQLLLGTAIDFLNDVGMQHLYDESNLVTSLCQLFDTPIEETISSLVEYKDLLRRHQRDLDYQIGMASFRNKVEPSIMVRHGQLIFGIPQKLVEHIPFMRGIMFTFFIDEYEHFFEDLQKHVNTLVREREDPVTFKIGARPHGMYTYQTWGGNEELKEGSDYELLNLDAVLRDSKVEYQTFARELCVKRIRFCNPGLPAKWDDGNAFESFLKSFQIAPSPEELVADRLSIKKGDSPWLAKLRGYLESYPNNVALDGTQTSADDVINRLRHSNPLIEKVSTFLIYRSWKDGDDILKSANAIAESAAKFDESSDPDTDHAKVLKHFRDDMRDQMLIDLNLDRQAGARGILTRYLGVDTWIDMSDGIIRNLISILKSVYGWSIFNGEDVYSEGGISLSSQIRGVEEASAWFVNSASILESERGNVDAGLRRVSELLRRLRFSRKPPECSLCRFALDLSSVDPVAKNVIKAAEMWSLLLQDSNRKNKNGGKDVTVFRINPLVAPTYYLPLGARGNIDLNTAECLAIFGSNDEADFKKIEQVRLDRCNPPFNKSTKKSVSESLECLADELPLF